ncbi:MAG: TRAP transporter large permease subunit [Lentisphaerae bacterium]|nr:TRAP transporter large permease subunit [Lentisphaerota bacterium]
MELCTNPVVIAVVILLVLAMLRLNVVFAIIIASLVGGMCAGMGEVKTLQAFSSGLGRGAQLAFNYALLGAFSIVISRSGITELLAHTLLKKINKKMTVTNGHVTGFKYLLLGLLTLIAMSSQNLIPVHIAFIPILIPPLLPVFEKLQLDRRAVACILTFGLITPYMCFPFGFGRIYINDILVGSLNSNGMPIKPLLSNTVTAMAIPALGMLVGLLIAVFISYRKPRVYEAKSSEAVPAVAAQLEIKPLKVIAGLVAIVVGFTAQIMLDSLFIASLAAVLVFVIAGVIKLRDTQDVFVQGVYLMGAIGIVMIAANGFAEVMKASGGVDSLVDFIAHGLGNNRGAAVFMMLFIGLLITMGIGSSFSTVPLIAAIYVPLCIKLGMSPMATLAVVGVAGALGDAGSPVSESVLGPTAGLNADGQHDHIYDSTVPTFIHFNIPLLIAGWIAGMIL